MNHPAENEAAHGIPFVGMPGEMHDQPRGGESGADLFLAIIPELVQGVLQPLPGFAVSPVAHPDALAGFQQAQIALERILVLEVGQAADIALLVRCGHRPLRRLTMAFMPEAVGLGG